MWLGWSIGAWACTGPDYAERVVGWSTDGGRVLLRSELTSPGDEDPPDLTVPYLRLALVDLATGRESRSWVVLTLGEKADAALRARRWQAAEAELVAAGVAIDGAQAPLPAPWTIAGHAGLKVVTGSCDEWARSYDLTSPTGQRTLTATGCGAEEGLYRFVAWAAPGGKGALLVADTGCVGHKKRFWVPSSDLP